MTGPHGAHGAHGARAAMPDALIVTTWMRRGAGTWLVTRAMFVVALLLVDYPPLDLSVATGLGVAAVATGLGVADAYARRREHALLGNLGVGTGVLATLLAIPALLGELVFAMLVTAVR